MALTEKIRLKLVAKGFDKLYDDHDNDWQTLANEARDLIAKRVEGGEPGVDDIKQILQPLVELHDHFRSFMAENSKLTQEYWGSRFTDYLLYRVYEPELHVPHPIVQVPNGGN
jgi:hypothetical protein